MAAINYAILTIAEAGDNIVTTAQLYGGTYTLFAHMLPKQGIEVRFAKSNKPEDIASLIDAKTKAVFFESIGHPAGNIIDIQPITAHAHAQEEPPILHNTDPTHTLHTPKPPHTQH